MLPYERGFLAIRPIDLKKMTLAWRLDRSSGTSRQFLQALPLPTFWLKPIQPCSCSSLDRLSAVEVDPVSLGLYGQSVKVLLPVNNLPGFGGIVMLRPIRWDAVLLKLS